MHLAQIKDLRSGQFFNMFGCSCIWKFEGEMIWLNDSKIPVARVFQMCSQAHNVFAIGPTHVKKDWWVRAI